MPETKTEFTYKEVTDKYEQLGYTYPKEGDFTEEEIQEAVNDLSEYYLKEDVATLQGTNHSPVTVEAFSKLARTLGVPEITMTNDGMKLTRETSAQDRRKSAISNLASQRWTEHRAIAKRALEADMREEL